MLESPSRLRNFQENYCILNSHTTQLAVEISIFKYQMNRRNQGPYEQPNEHYLQRRQLAVPRFGKPEVDNNNRLVPHDGLAAVHGYYENRRGHRYYIQSFNRNYRGLDGQPLREHGYNMNHHRLYSTQHYDRDGNPQHPPNQPHQPQQDDNAHARQEQLNDEDRDFLAGMDIDNNLGNLDDNSELGQLEELEI